MLVKRPDAATFSFAQSPISGCRFREFMTASLPLAPVTPAPVLRLVAQQEGLLQIHTAPFRGSFGSVLSQALRTAGLGSRVLVSQLLKGGVDQGLESSLWLCGRLQWLRPGVPYCISEPAASQSEELTAQSLAAQSLAAQSLAAVQQVWAYSRERLLSGAVDLLVLDELGLAVELGYLDKAEVLATLERRPVHLDVIVTGPAMAPELMAMADQVTKLRRGL
jgi:cob(I)alamin adenosyltransferase